MTSGERMVFAAEFVRVLAKSERRDAAQAAWEAGLAVAALRRAAQSGDGPSQSSDVVAMLDDMLSNGGDR